MTRGVRGAEGARAGFGFGFGALAGLLDLDVELAAVFRAAAFRAGEDGLARPDRPRRCTLPITAFRVTPPNCLAI